MTFREISLLFLAESWIRGLIPHEDGIDLGKLSGLPKNIASSLHGLSIKKHST